MSLHLNGTNDPGALIHATGLSADALRGNFERHNARTDDRLTKATSADAYFASKGHGIPHPSMMGAAMLLEQRATPAYAGTVARPVIDRRRAANKAARKARQAARR